MITIEKLVTELQKYPDNFEVQSMEYPGDEPWICVVNPKTKESKEIKWEERSIGKTAKVTTEYWAWWDNESKEFKYIYPRKFLVEMCSPDGFQEASKQEKGRIIKVTVEEIEV